jgi:hypothetical protein
VSNYDHANIWSKLSIIMREGLIFHHWYDHLNGKNDLYLICKENIVTGFFHFLNTIIIVEEVGCQDHDNSLQVIDFVLKRNVFKPMSILSK